MKLAEALKVHESAFGMSLDAQAISRLESFYKLVLKHNELLHLVAPASAEEFAIRHVLESLVLLDYLPQNARFADVGAGAGLPSIPCLLVREDTSALLIESKERKAAYLKAALPELGIEDRAAIFDRQFTEASLDGCSVVTSRALDKFSERIPKLLKWSGRRRIILFGGPTLREILTGGKVAFEPRLLPMSEQRFIFDIDRR